MEIFSFSNVSFSPIGLVYTDERTVFQVQVNYCIDCSQDDDVDLNDMIPTVKI